MLRARLAAAIAAFKSACYHPSFAVIYDETEGDPETGSVIREEYYERFGSPEQAAEMYRSAFPDAPIDPDGRNFGNARLVLILGPIDSYRRPT